jgi:hypothetical protein
LGCNPEFWFQGTLLSIWKEPLRLGHPLSKKVSEFFYWAVKRFLYLRVQEISSEIFQLTRIFRLELV